MDDVNLKKWKPKPLPKDKICMFQGVIKCCNRVCCDAIGTDVSPEFCFYCRYHSTISNIEPYVFAKEFNKFLYELKEKQIKGLNKD